MNDSLLEKSKPLPDFYYETLAREAEMPRPQLSKASAVSYCKIQLDILTRLAEHRVHIAVARSEASALWAVREGESDAEAW